MHEHPSLRSAWLHALSRHWTHRARDQSWIAWLGLALLASGVFHVGVQLVLGGPLEGPVSWRKPIVFGLSSGIFSLSIAWLIGQLPATRTRAALAAAYVVALAAEVGLITLQAWRGVPSHFNLDTRFDGAVFTAMGLLIAVVTVIVVVWTIQRARIRVGEPALDLAVRHGMIYAVGSLVVGIGMIASSQEVTAAGTAAVLEPDAYRALALLKLPHAVGFHGIQALPLLAFVLARVGETAAWRQRWMVVASAGYGLLFAVSLAWPLLERTATAAVVLPGRGVLAALVPAAVGLVLLPFVVAMTRAPRVPALAPRSP